VFILKQLPFCDAAASLNKYPLCLSSCNFCGLPILQSYAGKYVPSISHYIVQAQAIADGDVHLLKKPRAVPADVERPVFKLGGCAIGNGFTGGQQLAHCGSSIVQILDICAAAGVLLNALSSVKAFVN
jgi:hypothetical protein